MDHINEIYKKRVAAVTRALYAVRCVKEDNVPCKIEEGLFLGSIGAASNKDSLKSLNITHILTVANLSALNWPTHPNDFTYKTIDVADREDTDIAQYFDECFDFIDDAKRLGRGVLVHCFVGRSRSVTVVVAYLMKKHHMSLLQALEHVRSKRPQAAPNNGFMSQLQNFEKSIKDPSTGFDDFSSLEDLTPVDFANGARTDEIKLHGAACSCDDCSYGTGC